MHGILNVLKPPGMTSHDVVSFVRRVYGIKRVGHAGTLDPAAAGVLPVFLGQATRLIEYQADADKSYRAELTFGYETDTGDDTGNVIKTLPFTMPSTQKAAECLATFKGVSEQVPPMHSAIKIDGKKLYELARAGITVERQSRSITIHSITLIAAGHASLLFDVTCSKGTYIRSLCMDIGQKLNIPAVMSFLVRTRVGAFCLNHAYSLEELMDRREELLLPQDIAVSHLGRLQLAKADSVAFRNGQMVTVGPAVATDAIMTVYDHSNHFIGIATLKGHSIIPTKVFHPA